MATLAHHHLGLHHVRVHARLRVVVHGHQGLVGHDPRHSPTLHNQVLGRDRVHELHVGLHQELAHDRRGEEGRVLDDHVVVLLIVLDAKFIKETASGRVILNSLYRENETFQP